MHETTHVVVLILLSTGRIFLFCIFGTQGLFEIICPQERLSIPCELRFSKANLILFVLCKLEGSVVHSAFTGGERLTNGTYRTACITNIITLHILHSALRCSILCMHTNIFRGNPSHRWRNFTTSYLHYVVIKVNAPAAF